LTGSSDLLTGFWRDTGSTSSWSKWQESLPSTWQYQSQRSVTKFTLSLVSSSLQLLHFWSNLRV